MHEQHTAATPTHCANQWRSCRCIRRSPQLCAGLFSRGDAATGATGSNGGDGGGGGGGQAHAAAGDAAAAAFAASRLRGTGGGNNGDGGDAHSARGSSSLPGGRGSHQQVIRLHVYHASPLDQPIDFVPLQWRSAASCTHACVCAVHAADMQEAQVAVTHADIIRSDSRESCRPHQSVGGCYLVWRRLP